MPFPSLEVLDSFKRGNENPLNNGGKWKSVAGSGSAGQVLAEYYQAVSGQESNAYWSESLKEPTIAAFVKDREAWNSSTRMWLFSCSQGNPEVKEEGGYILQIRKGGAFTQFELYRGIILGSIEFEVKSNDGIALQVLGGKVTVWHKPGSEAWVNVLEVSDSTYKEGFSGVHINGEEGPGWSNFSIGKEKFEEKLAASLSFSGKLTPHKEGAEHTNVLGMIIG
jgi:hypothetical protein